MSDIFEEAKVLQEGTNPVVENSEQPTTATPQAEVDYKGRKWTQDDILKKFESADSYIEQLKMEKDKLEAAVNKGATLSDVLERLDTQKETNEPKAVEYTTPAKEVDVEAVAINAYQKMKQREVMEDNLKTSINEMQKVFGDKAVEILKLRAGELDMTLDEAKQLAATKPKAFQKMFFDGQGSKQTVAPSYGTINTQTLQNKPQEVVSLRKMKNKDLVNHALNIAKNIQ